MFKLDEKMDINKAKNLSAIVLAFVGDAVYSLFVREKLTFEFDYKSGELNKLATAKVNAVAQAEFLKQILPSLTDDEMTIFKRARNAKKPTRAKHASVADYNVATGFEAVIGYLYLTGQNDRLNFLLNKGNDYEG